MKNIFIISIIILIMSSCAALEYPSVRNDNNIKNVEIGMTKEEVVAIMGKDYLSAGSYQSDEGPIQIMRWIATAEDSWYELHFVNNILQEWSLVTIPSLDRFHPPHPPRPMNDIPHHHID